MGTWQSSCKLRQIMISFSTKSILWFWGFCLKTVERYSINFFFLKFLFVSKRGTQSPISVISTRYRSLRPDTFIVCWLLDVILWGVHSVNYENASTWFAFIHVSIALDLELRWAEKYEIRIWKSNRVQKWALYQVRILIFILYQILYPRPDPQLFKNITF